MAKLPQTVIDRIDSSVPAVHQTRVRELFRTALQNKNRVHPVGAFVAPADAAVTAGIFRKVETPGYPVQGYEIIEVISR